MPELRRDGVRLAYDEAGSGGPALLFVHGFGGNSTHFADQLEYFKRRHRVVALDRRGHGRSDKPEGPYAIPAIAEEVRWTVRERGLHKPVLVVHSQGGLGLEIVAQDPDLVSALVVLDAPVDPPAEVRAQLEQLLLGLRSPHYKEALDAMCEHMIFAPTDDKARRAALHGALAGLPQHVLVATWEAFLTHDPAPVAKRCKVPLLYVGGVMPCNEATLRGTVPHAMIGRAIGSGHFIQCDAAAQVNAMIEKFLTLI